MYLVKLSFLQMFITHGVLYIPSYFVSNSSKAILYTQVSTTVNSLVNKLLLKSFLSNCDIRGLNSLVYSGYLIP